jgi:hypothetical protein
MSAVAELIEDGGAAAVGDEFFRSRPFLEAEGATHSLRISSEQGELLTPLIVREIASGPERDAISPYGYPGLAAGSWGGVPQSLPAVALGDPPPPNSPPSRP